MVFRGAVFFSIAAFLFFSSMPMNLSAATWPEKPINMIVAWAPGGGTDRVARSLANILSEKLGVPVPVLNRPGANGGVGHTTLAQARPDGYTIGFITPQLVTGPIMGLTKLTYRELTPLALVNNDPGAVTVKVDAPWNSLKDFVEYARKNPHKIRIGNSGPGGTWHMVAVSLERVSGAKFIHMPYSGAPPAITDLMGGHIEAVTFSAAEVAPQVQDKFLKMLAVTSSERMENFPNVPTAIEQGYDLDLGTWRGLAVPNGTPVEVRSKLEKAVKESVNDPRFKDFMKHEAFGILYLDSEKFVRFVNGQEEAYKVFFKDYKK